MCKNCTLVSLDPLPTEEELQAYYASRYRTQVSLSHEVSSKILEPEQARADRIMPLLLSQKRKIDNCLDIGCSTGTLLKNISTAYGENTQRHGLEFNDNYRNYALSKGYVSSKEYAYNVPVEQLDLQETERFDLITLVHVLEHMHNPLSALQTIWKRLADDGIFYVEVPNLKTPYGDLKKSYFAIYHLYYFSDKTLKQLLRKSGFEILETKVQARTSIAYVCKKSTPQKEIGACDSYQRLIRRLKMYEMTYPLRHTIFLAARYIYRKVFK